MYASAFWAGEAVIPTLRDRCRALETVAAARHPSVCILETEQHPPKSLAPLAGLLASVVATLMSVTLAWCHCFTSENLCLTRRRHLSAACVGLYGQLQLHHGPRRARELLIIIVRRRSTNHSTQRIVVVVVGDLFDNDSLENQSVCTR